MSVDPHGYAQFGPPIESALMLVRNRFPEAESLTNNVAISTICNPLTGLKDNFFWVILLYQTFLNPQEEFEAL